MKGHSVLSANVHFLGLFDTVPGSFFKADEFKAGVCKELRTSRYKLDTYPTIAEIAHAAKEHRALITAHKRERELERRVFVDEDVFVGDGGQRDLAFAFALAFALRNLGHAKRAGAIASVRVVAVVVDVARLAVGGPFEHARRQRDEEGPADDGPDQP